MKLKIKSLILACGVSSLAFQAQADDLLQIYQLAQEKDPVILQSKAQRDIAFEQITESRASLLPQIGFAAGAKYTGTDDDLIDSITNTNASVGLSQSLYSKTNWTSLSISEKNATRVEAVYGNDVQSLIIRVSNAYFNVLRAIDNVSFVEANKTAVGRQLEQTKQRFNVGLTAITDVHEAQAEYDRTLAQEIQARNDLSNSYEDLRELTGLEHRELNVLNTQRFEPNALEQGSDFWLATATDRNLELNAQRISKEIAQEQIELAQSGHLPTLDLTAGIGYNNNQYGSDFATDNKANSGNIGLEFNWPIYLGGSIDSQVRQAQFSYIASSEALEQTYRTVQSTVNSVVNNVSASIGSVKAFEQTVVSSQSALEATEAGFEVGTRTIVDVQDATRNLYSAKSDLSNARYDYILNMLALKQAAGTLTEEDVVLVNSGLMPAQ
ncbi:outer membrane channel protein TolC [Agarivorans sp. 1_MG-2023]|uniref:outer membrane channel protein TolC n=1 Tax=Agarivorans sp. 1_MG-2023 TaxID=3062634 RepID=UPI0026E1ADDA|nr:outer membrane channel protein TolC [Agarivorans sp. 1_MG-2023]MDO6763735.1 outer membrane channel protein TolC [Agarivorans sp. 1_MG-2023]